MRKRLLLLIILIAGKLTICLGQEFSISGRVLDTKNNPIFFATVYVKGGSRYCLSEEDGSYKLLLPKGTYTLVASSMGYQPKEIEITVTADRSKLNFTLEEITLALGEVQVTAKAVESRSGTSVYEIGEQAIQQIQAMHLGDVLSLLPGNRPTPSDINRVQQPNLRSVSGSVANNFGTQIIIDGAAIGTDADMQASNPAISFSGGDGGVTGRGVDLRNISAASIESVEVVTGVASPRHGNLTSGAILVTSRVGRAPLKVSANLNPTAYQFSASGGTQLSNNMGFVNSDITYTYSDGSPIDRKNYYNNIGLGLRWRRMLNQDLRWNNTVSFQLNSSHNGQRFDPDELYADLSQVRSQAYTLNVRGDMKLLGRLSYTLVGRAENSYSEFEGTKTDGPLPLATGLETGTYFTSYSPLVYEQRTIITGLPLNFNGRIEADQNLESGNYFVSFNTGSQFVYNKNLGKGRVVQGAISGLAGSAASRSAKFHEIPASQSLSLYHETDAKRITEKTRHSLRLGLRYDYMDLRYHLFSPRISYFSQFMEKLKFRAAWGVSYKAPAMIQYYPGPVYFDYTNLDFYATNPLERMAIVSTYVYQPTNDHLKPSRGDTKEFGIDWLSGEWGIRSTFFRKTLSDGIYRSTELLVLEKQLYTVIDRPANRMPLVAPAGVEKIIRRVNVLKNTSEEVTDGFELVVNPPRIRPTNTQFDLRFSYMISDQKDFSHTLNISNFVVGDEGARYGVYENPLRTSYRARGNVTMIQHIPSLALVVTLVTELNFVDYSQRTGASLFAFAYYDSQGVYHEIPEEQRESAQFETLKLPDRTYSITEKPPFYTNYHMQIRKETKTGHSFSFYANNVFWYNPQYEWNERLHRLNGSISFGFGVSFRLN